MKINEIRKTETIEKLVRIEYVSDDGTVFGNEEECKKYEESALFVVSKKLKRLTKDNTSQYEINDSFSCDDVVEIFDVQTERDLENLRRYLYLKMRKNGASEDRVKECFTLKDGKRNRYVFDNVTVGHEVMIFWNYEENYFWVYNDGSINGYCDFSREKITKLIAPKENNEQ